MAGITLAQADAQLQAYLAAEAAVLSGQSYTIHGRTLTRADLTSIQQGIETWNARVNTLTAKVSGRSRGRTIVPAG